MVYREISIYRAMRLIADGKTKNLYFQTNISELHRVADYKWDIITISKKKFFELESERKG